MNGFNVARLLRRPEGESGGDCDGSRAIEQEEKLEAIGLHREPYVSRCLLLGCRKSGKTSMLFQYALNALQSPSPCVAATQVPPVVTAATHSGRSSSCSSSSFPSSSSSSSSSPALVPGMADQSYVLYFALSQEALTPRFPDKVAPALLKRVVFKYCGHGAALWSLLATFQLECERLGGDQLPCAVVVDDMSSFFPELSPGSNEQLLAIAKTCALLQNLQSYINGKWAERLAARRAVSAMSADAADAGESLSPRTKRARLSSASPVTPEGGNMAGTPHAGQSSGTIEQSCYCELLASHCIARSTADHFLRASASGGGGPGDPGGWDGKLPGVLETMHRWFPIVCLLDRPAASCKEESVPGKHAVRVKPTFPHLPSSSVRVLMAGAGVRCRISELAVPVW